MTKSVQNNSTDSFYAVNIKSHITTKNIFTTTTVVALGALTVYQYFYDLPVTGSQYLIGGFDVTATIGLVFANRSSSLPQNRFSEAMEAAHSGNGDILLHINDYNLTDEQETSVLEALFKKEPATYYILSGKKEASPSLCAKVVEIALKSKHEYLADNLHRFNLSGEKKLNYIKQLVKLFPDAVAENITKYNLSHEQEKELAFALAHEPLSRLSLNLPNFSTLNLEDKRELALVNTGRKLTHFFKLHRPKIDPP